MSQWGTPPGADGGGDDAPDGPPAGLPPLGGAAADSTQPRPGGPQYGTPQFGTPPSPTHFGTPQFGTPQFGGYQPPAVPYEYGHGASVTANLASPGRRIGGYLIDAVILFVVVAACWIPFLLSASSMPTSNDVLGPRSTGLGGGAVGTMILAYAAAILLPILYHVCFVAVKGQTPGAMLVKVKVVRLSDGQTPGWGPAIMRWLPNLAGILCSLLTLVLWIWALVNLFSNDLRQTPFDLAAKTVVIDAD